MDLDLVTIHLGVHEKVRQVLDAACKKAEEGISFSVKAFEEVDQAGKKGVAVTIGFKTEQGAANSFDIDIVYRIDSDYTEIESPTAPGDKIRAVTIENIIADKLATCWRFTRLF